MDSPLRQTRSHLMALFQQEGLHPRGDLGQNFLIDLNLLESIVAEAELQPDDVVLEVGAGTGGLTTFLAAEAGEVVSVEFDAKMFRLAHEAVAHRHNVTLLNCDALKSKHQMNPLVMDAVLKCLAGDGLSADSESDPSSPTLTSGVREGQTTADGDVSNVPHVGPQPQRWLKLVANLPYHVGTPVIANLLASDLPLQRMVVTIQWELAQRLCARPQTSDYSALSVFVQSQCRIKIVHKLGPSVFWPRPDVDSAIVRIDPDPAARMRIDDRGAFQVFLREVFSQRRKLLRGVLSQKYKDRIGKAAIETLLSELQLSPDARAEELEVDQLVELSNRLHGQMDRDALKING